MNIHDRSRDVTGQLSGTTHDVIKQANKIWDERSREEQRGLLAGLVIFLFAGLFAIVWNAARTGTGSGRYVELHKDRDEDRL